ncbi:MAG TPA: LysE family translocator, partial [Roseiarcus sp.]|nr:LysE family translocator [Roseiarcus sp.]
MTPGPNNLMLMTSGVKYGAARTLPHLAGVILGFALMVALVGLGLDILFERFPKILPVMRIAGSIYMVWLALRIALAKPIGEAEGGGRPIGFLAAAGFQWVNPKAWVMALSALATYAGVVDGYMRSVLFIAAMCGLMAIPCSGAWMAFG